MRPCIKYSRSHPNTLYPRGGSPDPLRKSACNAVDAAGQETHRAKNRTALKIGFWEDFYPILSKEYPTFTGAFKEGGEGGQHQRADQECVYQHARRKCKAQLSQQFDLPDA